MGRHTLTKCLTVAVFCVLKACVLSCGVACEPLREHPIALIPKSVQGVFPFSALRPVADSPHGHTQRFSDVVQVSADVGEVVGGGVDFL